MGEEQEQGNARQLEGDRDENETQIGGRRVTEGAFEVHLGQGDQGSTDRTDGSDRQQDISGDRREPNDRHQLHQHDRPAGHHDGIPQDRSRVRALHGFIEPEVHRELGTFAHRTCDESQTQQADAEWSQGPCSLEVAGPVVEVVELHRACKGRECDHPHQQQNIANALGQESVAGGGHDQGLGIPEPHQQIGRKREHLQQEIAHEEVAAEHHTAHGPFEETDQGVEAGQGPLFVEVAQGIDLADQAHRRDELQRSQIRQREIEANAEIQVSGLEPGQIDMLRSDLVDRADHQAAVHNGEQRDQQIEVGRRTGAIALDPPRRPGQRQEHPTEPVDRDQPDQLEGEG